MLRVNHLIGFGAKSKDIEFVGYATGSSTAVNTTFSVSTSGLTGGIDTQARKGDFLVLAWGRGNSGGSDKDFTTSDFSDGGTLTWTERVDVFANSTYETDLTVYVAEADVDPPASISINTHPSASRPYGALLLVFRNVDFDAPLDGIGPPTATGTGTSVSNPPSSTPATDRTIAVAIAATAASDTCTGIPANYTALGQVGADTGSIAFGIAAAYVKGLYAGVAEDPGNFTWDFDAAGVSWCATTLIIKPA